jgi:hypothetical protein
MRSSETSGATEQTTRRHIPEDDTLQNHRCENLKSGKINLQLIGVRLEIKMVVKH